MSPSLISTVIDPAPPAVILSLPAGPAHGRRRGARVPQHQLAVERSYATVAHQHAAGNDGRPDVGSLGDVDEMRDRIEHRRLAGAGHADGDDVGLLARL